MAIATIVAFSRAGYAGLVPSQLKEGSQERNALRLASTAARTFVREKPDHCVEVCQTTICPKAESNALCHKAQ